jgi:hypothetical protein
VNPPVPLGVIVTAGGVLLDDGLLRVRLTVKEPLATPDGASIAVTVAICTSFGFIGDAEHKRTGIPLICGAALSILMVMGRDLEIPTPLVAEQIRVSPAVSAVRLVDAHPVEDVIPDSGSVTFQLTVTALRYQPLLPSVPVICGVIVGAVISAIVIAKSALVFIGSLMPEVSVAMLKKP